MAMTNDPKTSQNHKKNLIFSGKDLSAVVIVVV